MRCGTHRRRENFGRDQESDGVGAELVEERRQEVHGLKGMHTGRGLVVAEVEGRDDEEDEAREETDLLHHLAAVELVVYQEGRKIVADQRHARVEQIPQPVGHDRSAGRNDLDEGTLEELVSVKENVVAEPGAGCGDDARPKVVEGQLQRVYVVARHVRLLLGGRELLAGRLHLVSTIVD